MKKIKRNSIHDAVQSVLSKSEEVGAIHLHAEDESVNGRHLSINGSTVLNFGSCGYLSLEHDEKLKDYAKQAIEKYGTQFPMSRTYVSSPLYKRLEDKLRLIYDAPMVISKNCTLAHLATMPAIVTSSDLIVLDHQVHASVQEAATKMASQGVDIEIIRHNNLQMLERLIKKFKGTYDKIWYMADGLYSMFGDFAPIKEMIALAEKHEELYLYVDDAHGTSWTGKNGSGYVMSQMDHKLYRKMILTANLGKAFGACGGVSLFPSEEMYQKVKIFGGPLTFSVQMEPATLGAAIASAEIHLSEDIYDLQRELRGKINYLNTLIQTTMLPLVVENGGPIFYIGVSSPELGNYMVEKLMKDGIYVNLGSYPAVPIKNTGIRITLTRNMTITDIEKLVDRLDYHFQTGMEVTGISLEKILKAFKLAKPEESPVKIAS